MTDRELMQQALEALDAYSWEQVQSATAALRERLAQPESCSRHKACERGTDGYCAQCHSEMYP